MKAVSIMSLLFVLVLLSSQPSHARFGLHYVSRPKGDHCIWHENDIIPCVSWQCQQDCQRHVSASATGICSASGCDCKHDCGSGPSGK